MNYNICIIGAKDTTIRLAEYLIKNVCKIDCIITVDESKIDTSQISGYSPITEWASAHGITVFQASSYSLGDEKSKQFFSDNMFGIGICMGWQRLIPLEVLQRFQNGIFGFHGSCAYLPYGRGRSPLNWSIVNGDKRFILNLFKYDEKADSPNVYQNRMFEINQFDTIRTLQYKNLLVSYDLVTRLIEDYRHGTIAIKHTSKDFDTFYPKRTPEDGRVSFHSKTEEIYNLIRGVTKPFPGAFANLENRNDSVRIWAAVPFDGILDFSKYRPGEIIEIFDENLLVRTVDGSLLIREYECNGVLKKGDVLL